MQYDDLLGDAIVEDVATRSGSMGGGTIEAQLNSSPDWNIKAARKANS